MRARLSPTAQLGALAALTAVLQLGPVLWPGPGYLLAMAATMPVAMATLITPRRCTWFYLATAILLGMIAREEMYVYLTLTGPLGLMIGMLRGRPAWRTIPLIALVLVGGMLLLPGLAGIYPWGGLERSWPPLVTLSAYASFALAYTSAWVSLFERVWVRVAAALRYTERQDP